MQLGRWAAGLSVDALSSADVGDSDAAPVELLFCLPPLHRGLCSEGQISSVQADPKTMHLVFHEDRSTLGAAEDLAPRVTSPR